MLSIAPMQSEHIQTVSSLEKLCFGPHWALTQFDRELDNPRCSYFVALEGEQVLAYLGYWKILEEAHITSVGVHPAQRKRRIAQHLMCYMIDDCIQHEIQWITLEVKASNVSAQKLYEKFGFAVMGRRKNYYQAEKEDALIMWTEDISEATYQDKLQELKQESQYFKVQERSSS